MLVAHRPAGVQQRSSLLRRMPMFYGKRDASATSFPVKSDVISTSYFQPLPFNPSVNQHFKTKALPDNIVEQQQQMIADKETENASNIIKWLHNYLETIRTENRVNSGPIVELNKDVSSNDKMYPSVAQSISPRAENLKAIVQTFQNKMASSVQPDGDLIDNLYNVQDLIYRLKVLSKLLKNSIKQSVLENDNSSDYSRKHVSEDNFGQFATESAFSSLARLLERSAKGGLNQQKSQTPRDNIFFEPTKV